MKEARSELTRFAGKIVNRGLVVGPGGNISVRSERTMLISPSGYDIAEVEPEQWCAVGIADGAVEEGALKPSSEVFMHLELYRSRPDVGAVIHTHPAHCIALGLISAQLPVLFPDQAALLGEVGFVDYVVPTTQALADAVALKAKTSDTLFLHNHGLVALGRNLREAFYRTEVAEESAKIYLLAKSAGEPRPLSDEEVHEIKGLASEAYRVTLLQNQS